MSSGDDNEERAAAADPASNPESSCKGVHFYVCAGDSCMTSGEEDKGAERAAAVNPAEILIFMP